MLCRLVMFLLALMSRADVPVDFGNSPLRTLLGVERPVLDPAGQLLADTNFVAQLFRVDGPPVLVPAPEGRSEAAHFFPERPGYFLAGSIRQIPGVSPGQTVQLEVRVWDRSLFSSYEAAVSGGGTTGSSGPFAYAYNPGPVPSPADALMREFPGMQLGTNPVPPPTIVAISPGEVLEGDSATLTAEVVGGRVPLTYRWQLAEAVVVEGAGLTLPRPGQTLRPGYLSVQLTVTDADGVTGQPLTHFLRIADRPAVVTGVAPMLATEGTVVNFGAELEHVSGPGAYRLRWRFADGSASEELTPTLRLPDAGAFPVEVAVAEGREVTLYHNLFSFADPPEYYAETTEYGDEVAFATTNRFLDRFSFLYYADLSQMTAPEREAVRGVVRFYRNDGPLLPGKQVSRFPESLIYESAPFRLSPGYVLQRFDDLGLTVPDWMTWTVEWIGVSQTAGRSAGLVLSDARSRFDAESVGTSFNDFWVRVGEQAWDLFHFGNFSPVADFASRSRGRDFGNLVFGDPQVFPVAVGNVPPRLTGLHIPQSGVAGTPLNFSATAEDLGDLTYAWDFGDGSGAEGATASHAYGTTGTFEVRLTARDASGAEVAGTGSVTITAERLPVEFLSEPPLSVAEREPYRYEVRYGAPGIGQEISLRATQLPAWLTLNKAGDGTEALVGTPGAGDLGTHAVTLELGDGTTTVEQSFLVSVLNVNDPPVLSGPSPAGGTVTAGQEFGPVVISATDPDPEDAVEFLVSVDPASVLPPGSYRLEGTGNGRELWVHPPRGVEGTATLTVTVRDLAGATDSGTFTLHVDPVPRYSFAATAGTGGTVRWQPEGEEFEQGTVLRVRAEAGAGYAFAGWTPDTFGTEPAIEFPLEADTALLAAFSDIEQPSLTLTSPTPGASTVDVVTVSGLVADNDAVAEVRWWLNGEDRGVLPTNNGGFQVDGVRLRSGTDPIDRENTLVVVARDATGNAATNTMVVVWTPNALLLVGSAEETAEGRTVSFPLQLKSETAVAGLSLRLTYDADFLGEPEFQWVGATVAGIGSVNLDTPGEILASVAAPQDIFTAGLQPVATVSFRVRSLPFRMRTYIEPELLEIANAFGDPIEGVDAQYGSAFLRPRSLKGDINGNRRLDIGDATLLQRLVTGLDGSRTWDLGLNDLNANNRLDSGDVIRVLRVVAGLDPQPVGAQSQPLAPMLSGRRTGLAASPEAPEARLEPAAVVSLPGKPFTLQVKLTDIPEAVRGASFVLEYPNAVIALRPNGIRGGSLLPAGVAPAFTNDLAGGTIRFAAAAPTNWTSATGILAELDFVVAAAAPDDEPLPIRIRGLEVTVNGYETWNLRVNPAAVSTPAALRRPIVVGLNNTGDTGWSFDVLAAPDSVLVLESTSDLRAWSRKGSYRYTPGQPLLFDPSAGGSIPTMQFFRWQSFLPATTTDGVAGPGGGR